MPLLIDAYNVIHVTGVLPTHLAGIDVEGLMRLIEVSRWSRDDVCLVCDGNPPPGGPPPPVGSIRAVFAGGGRQADDVIAALIARSTTPRRLAVVSLDRFVLQQASRRRCRTIRSNKFLELLAHDHAVWERAMGRQAARPARKPGGPLPASSVDHWIKHFGLDESVLKLPSSRPLGHPDHPAARDPSLDRIDEIDMEQILGRDSTVRRRRPPRE